MRAFSDLFQPFGLPRLLEDNFFGNLFTESAVKKYWSAMTDIKKTDYGYLFEMDMPGLDKKDIDVEINDGYLVVTGKKKEKKEEKSELYRMIERTRVGYYKCLRLPEDVSKDEIEATYNEGVLELKLKRLEQPKEETKKIEIK